MESPDGIGRGGREVTGELSRRRLLVSMGLLAGAAAGCSVGTGRPGLSATAEPASSAPSLPSVRSVPAAPSSTGVDDSASAPTTTSITPPTASSPPDGPAVEIGRGSGTRPQVALTFHGGGDPATAREILDITASRGAKITVLAIGTWLQANPALAGAILGGGHDLGNHTWSHPVLSDLPEPDVRDEITRCRDLLIQLTGSPGPFFRTSSGQHATDLVLRVAGACGYPNCLSYDIDPTDWTDPGPDVVRNLATTATAGSIVSLHFGHPGTVQALPGVLDDLQARGLTPVTASALLAP
ncbi:MAG TPA: polysaccharide deacetylase family protein [Nakamurella sp.]